MVPGDVEALLRHPPPCRVVPYRAEHRDEVLRLQRHLWHPEMELNSAYLEWKYHQNPYIREPLVYLAFVGDRLAGMRGAFGTRWEAGESAENFTLPYPDDLVIDPAFREQGLHRVIMNFVLEDLARRGYRYVVNLSASRITHQASVNMGWRKACGMMPLHRRALRRGLADAIARAVGRLPYLWRWMDRLSSLGGPQGERLFERFDSNSVALTRPGEAGPLFVRSAPLVEEMAHLVARLPWSGHLRHVRDETYLTWRFRNPLRSYRYLYAGGDRLEGYLVLQRPLSGIDRVSIVDWEAESDAIAEQLLATAVELGEFPALYAWGLGVSPTGRRMLDRRAFRPVRSKHETAILVRAVRDADLGKPLDLGRRLDDVGQWDMRMLYSMAG